MDGSCITQPGDVYIVINLNDVGKTDLIIIEDDGNYVTGILVDLFGFYKQHPGNRNGFEYVEIEKSCLVRYVGRLLPHQTKLLVDGYKQIVDILTWDGGLSY